MPLKIEPTSIRGAGSISVFSYEGIFNQRLAGEGTPEMGSVEGEVCKCKKGYENLYHIPFCILRQLV